jgi:SHS family lactate transporter-like MFS transporter
MENQVGNKYDYQGNPPSFTWASISEYCAGRLPTLKPPSLAGKKHMLNPFPPILLITRKQWAFIMVAFVAWTWDAFDFFSVSLTATLIAEDLGVSVKDITWGITLVLMLRSVGAVIFGIAGDKWGRKWPFIINCGLFVVLELGTGFVQTYKQFLGVRALFGIAMGGIYGNCAATALDDCPVEARGIISGFLQQGYAFGYLLCVVFNRAITYNTSHSWRALFWFGAAPPVLIILWRMILPETDTFKAQKYLEKEQVETGNGGGFFHNAKQAFSTYWLMFIYLVLLMAGMNFMSHGSQDLFPTLLTAQLGFSADRSTVTNSVANLGAIAGGIFVGHMSEFTGRRLSIMICCVFGGALIYPWAFVHNNGINAAVFFLQFFVQGAWGVIPIHISELSPPNFRSFIVGTAYQLGNLASSASSTIESKIGENFPLTNAAGKTIHGKYNYGKVMAIFMGCVFGYVLLITFVGPERRNANLLSSDVDRELGVDQYKFDKEKEAALHNEDVEAGHDKPTTERTDSK